MPFLPVVVDVEPTVRCNLRCRMCQTTTWDRRCDDLTAEKFRMLLDQVPTLAKVKLQGMGEPLLNAELFRMIDEAHRRHISVETVTNGTLLTESVCKRLVESRPELVCVSIDGATAATHEAIRCGSRFEQVLAGTRRLLAARGRAKWPIVGVWTTGQRENVSELTAMVELFADMKVDLMTFSLDMTDWGKVAWAGRLDASRLDAADVEVTGLIARAQSAAGRRRFHFRVHHAYGYGHPHRDCPWPWYSCFISADGHVMPCCFLGDPEGVSFGNVLRTPFAEIWNGERYRAFRRRIASGRVPGFCRTCYAPATSHDESRR